MKKKKTKEKRIYHKLTFWLGVLALGTIVGISIQFSRAWVEPDNGPTDNNIAAPINTGATEQTKTGDICTTAPNGTGTKKCLSEQVSWPKCTLDGGVPVIAGGVTMCKFPGATCGADWTSYLNYSETIAKVCTGGGSCGTSETSPFHNFDNIDPSTEWITYYDGDQVWSTCTGACIDNCGCCCAGYGCGGYCTCCCGWDKYPCNPSCSSRSKFCTSTQTAIGCILK